MLAHVLQLYYSASVSCGAGQNLGGEFSASDRWLVVGVWSAGGPRRRHSTRLLPAIAPTSYSQR